MPGNSLEEARFDHVSDTGELVFVSGAGKFAVKIDEALERAHFGGQADSFRSAGGTEDTHPTHPADFANSIVDSRWRRSPRVSRKDIR